MASVILFYFVSEIFNEEQTKQSTKKVNPPVTEDLLSTTTSELVNVIVDFMKACISRALNSLADPEIPLFKNVIEHGHAIFLTTL